MMGEFVVFLIICLNKLSVKKGGGAWLFHNSGSCTVRRCGYSGCAAWFNSSCALQRGPAVGQLSELTKRENGGKPHIWYILR